MPLEFSEIEARLAQKLGDPDLAGALTRELQAHFAESLVSRLEAGYGQAEALTATEKEFGKANRLVNQIARPYQRRSKVWAFLTTLVGIVVFFQCSFLLHYLIGDLDANGGYVSIGAAIASWFAVVIIAARLRSAHIFLALGGVVAGFVLTIAVLATYCVPIREYGLAPQFVLENETSVSLQYRDVDQAMLDGWAKAGASAFARGQRKVPSAYRQGNLFLSPAAKDYSSDPWPLLSNPGFGNPRLPLTEYVAWDEARTRWETVVSMVQTQHQRLEKDAAAREELSVGQSMSYLQKLQVVGFQFFKDYNVYPTVGCLYWWGYLMGAAVGFLGRQHRNRRTLKRAA
jgi:hypothetical protein